MLYYAQANPYFSCCNHVWKNTCVASLDMQNKLVRIIYNIEYDANTEIIDQDLKSRKFITNNKLQIAIHR